MKIGTALFIGYTAFGIKFEKTDMDNRSIYISLPEFSEYYDEKFPDPERFSKRIKEMLIEEIGSPDLRLFLRVRKGEHWTKDMGFKAARSFVSSV